MLYLSCNGTTFVTNDFACHLKLLVVMEIFKVGRVGETCCILAYIAVLEKANIEANSELSPKLFSPAPHGFNTVLYIWSANYTPNVKQIADPSLAPPREVP